MIELLKNKWVLEWSKNQKCFHVETVEEMVFKNFQAFVDCVNSEYIPICFTNTQYEAHMFAERIKKLNCESVSEHNEKWDKIWSGKFE